MHLLSNIFSKDFYQVISKNRTAIMGLAMLSVMLFHQFFTYVFPLNAFHVFGNWGVDVFLFLSGMGLVRSLNNNTLPIYYKRRFKRIIPSCIMCGTTKYVIFILLGSSVAKLKEDLNLGWWSLASLDLWFIATIIILYAISPLLNNLLHRWPYITFSAIIISMFINGMTLRPVVGSEWASPLGILSWTIERLPVFAAGMFVSIKKDWLDNIIPYSVLFLLAAIGIKMLDKFGYMPQDLRTYSFFALVFGMPSLIIINTYFLKIAPFFLRKVIMFMGEYSLELYLVHEFIFYSLKYIFVNNYSWLLPTAFMLSFLSAYLFNCVINKAYVIHKQLSNH